MTNAGAPSLLIVISSLTYFAFLSTMLVVLVVHALIDWKK